MSSNALNTPDAGIIVGISSMEFAQAAYGIVLPVELRVAKSIVSESYNNNVAKAKSYSRFGYSTNAVVRVVPWKGAIHTL